jgi:hypothetical protein
MFARSKSSLQKWEIWNITTMVELVLVWKLKYTLSDHEIKIT